VRDPTTLQRYDGDVARQHLLLRQRMPIFDAAGAGPREHRIAAAQAWICERLARELDRKEQAVRQNIHDSAATQADLAAAQADLAAAKAEVGRLAEIVERAERTNEHLRRELSRTTEVAAHAVRDRERLQQEVASRDIRLEQLLRELPPQREELDCLREEMAALRASRSWRWSAPMRALARPFCWRYSVGRRGSAGIGETKR
jgi:hypothetical protein